jgi:hypothetical protein
MGAMSIYEIGGVAVLAALSVANAVKAAERSRATLQIAAIYHAARLSHPESLGANRSLSTTLRHPRIGFSEHLLFVAPRVGAG